MKLYMPYDVILSSKSEDLTAEEKARLRRIKAIPRAVRDTVCARVKQLDEQVRALEKERDELIDYLNGEEVTADGN